VDGLALFPQFPQVLRQLRAVLGADDQVDALDGENLGRRRLRVAAGDRHDGVRVRADRPPDDLPALLVAGVRHGARVDDVNVGRFPEIDLLVSFLFQELPDRFRVHEVDLAADGVERHGWHQDPPISPNSYMMQLSATSAAVSVRRMRRPRLTGRQPAATASLASSSANPPSGPTMSSTSGAGWRLFSSARCRRNASASSFS